MKLVDLLEKLDSHFYTEERKDADGYTNVMTMFRHDDNDSDANSFRDAVLETESSDLDSLWETAYEFVDHLRDSLSIKDSEFPDDDWIAEAVDSLVPCYNIDRIKWLTRCLSNTDYVDQAVSEGLVDMRDFSLFEAIGVGIFEQKREIFTSLLSYFKQRIHGELDMKLVEKESV